MVAKSVSCTHQQLNDIYEDYVKNHRGKDRKSLGVQRFGQLVVNALKIEHDPELFYEEDTRQAYRIAYDRYVRGH